MAGSTCWKSRKISDVLRALDSSDFDDIDVPELADSDSDGEEAMSADVIVEGDTEVKCQ